MGLARGRGRGRGKGGISKAKNRIPLGKPPPLMGRLAPPPGMALRPRGPPIPPLVPRMRPPPPGMRSPRLLPPPIPPVLGPPRPPMPPFHPPPHHGRPLPPPPPPPLALRPPVPPPSLLRARGQGIPPPLMRGPGFRPPGPPMMQKFGPGKRNAVIQKGPKKKQKGKKVEIGDESEINKPWVTEAMKNEIQKKHKLYQKAKKSNQQTDWDEFKEQRNRVTTMIREAKIEYIGSHPEEEGDFFCETCDRQFNSSLKYAEHVAEHATCGIEGCTFTAHPKVVAKHVEFQHLSGLFNRIGNMDSPEDIAKWISDRKRHFPTKENIAKKQAELIEKTQRGERLFKDKSRFNRDVHNRCRGNDFNKRGRGRGKGRFFQKRPRFEYEVCDDDNDDDDEQGQNAWRRNLCPFPGTRFLEAEEASKNCSDEQEEIEDFSDTEWESSDKVQTMSHVAPVVSRALNSLICSYGSDASDSDNDAPVEIPILKTELAATSHLESVTANENKIPNSLVITTEENKSYDISSTSAPSPTNQVFNDDLVSHQSFEFNKFIEPKNISCSATFTAENTQEFLVENNIPSEVEDLNKVSQSQNGEFPDIAMESGKNEIKLVHLIGTPHAPSAMNEVCNDHNVSQSSGFKEFIEPESISCGASFTPESTPNFFDKSNNVPSEVDDWNEIAESQNGELPDVAMESGKKEIKSEHLVGTPYERSMVPRSSMHNSRPNSYANTSFQNRYPRRRRTLLEKLLAKEILHERNVILQCVRYVVEKEFFVEQSTSVKNHVNTKKIEECNNDAKESLKRCCLLQCIKFIVQRNFFEEPCP